MGALQPAEIGDRDFRWIVGIGTFAAVLLLLLVGAGMTTAAPGDFGEPNVTVHVPENQVNAGEEVRLTLQVENDAHPADRDDPADILVARSTSVTVTDDGPFNVTTAEQSVGTLEPGAVQPAEIGVTVPEDVDPGTYEITVEINYSNVTDATTNITERHERTESVTVVVREQPRFNVEVVETTAQIGTGGTMTVDVENLGNETARDVVLGLESTSQRVGFGADEAVTPADSTTVDELAPGEVATVTYDLAVSAGAAEQSYGFDATVEYVDEDGIKRIDERPATSFTPLPEQAFELAVVESTAQVGERGTIAVEVENVGNSTVEDVSVGLASESNRLRFGGQEIPILEDTARISTLAAGDSQVVEFDVVIEPDIPPREFGLDAHIGFVGPEGIEGVVDDLVVGIEPYEEQSVALTDVESTLRPGESGVVTATFVNEGPIAVEDVSVTIAEGIFQPRSPTQAIGDLDVGEATEISIRGTVPTEADAVDQQLTVVADYKTTAGYHGATDTRVQVPVADRRDAIQATAVNTSFDPGEERLLELELENHQDIDLRDIRVTVVSEDPIESDFPSTSIARLDAGASETVAVLIEIDDDAPPTTFPLTVEIDYVDELDETQSVRPQMVTVDVSDDPEEFLIGLEAIVFVVLIILVIAVLVWLYRR